MPSVYFSRRTEQWIVRGEPRPGGPDGELLLVEEDLPHIRVVDLRNALEAERRFYGTAVRQANVSLLSKEHFDSDGPVGPVAFTVVDGRPLVTLTCLVNWPEDGDEAEAMKTVRRLISPLLVATRSALEHLEHNDWWSDPVQLAIDMRVAMPWRGKSAGDLFKQAQDILALCEACASGVVTRETVADLVRGGAGHLLVDQPEGNWLDAEAEEYDLTSIKGKVSLGQAVARFANAEEGGLVVIGAKTKKVPGGEVIRQVRGVVPRQADTVARYTRALDRHLYPPAYGLRIYVVPTDGDRALIILDVPPQPEELKPFLVHGAITADGDTEGSFISIVQRRGEGSIPITAPMIHASIAAGRALLRREWSRQS